MINTVIEISTQPLSSFLATQMGNLLNTPDCPDTCKLKLAIRSGKKTYQSNEKVFFMRSEEICVPSKPQKRNMQNFHQFNKIVLKIE